MWDGFDTAAVEGLRYLQAIASQPVHPSTEMFAAFLSQPRPERKSLTKAVQASREPTGPDVLDWMAAIGWVELVEVDSHTEVQITELGGAVVQAADEYLPQMKSASESSPVDTGDDTDSHEQQFEIEDREDAYVS